MFGLGTTELIIISVIILVIFGAKRLPGIGKTVSRSPVDIFLKLNRKSADHNVSLMIATLCLVE